MDEPETRLFPLYFECMHPSIAFPFLTLPMESEGLPEATLQCFQLSRTESAELLVPKLFELSQSPRMEAFSQLAGFGGVIAKVHERVELLLKVITICSSLIHDILSQATISTTPFPLLCLCLCPRCLLLVGLFLTPAWAPADCGVQFHWRR